MDREEQLLQAQYSYIKLIVCLQASLELFDDVEGTKFHRHDLKRSINNTKSKLIATLNKTYEFIDTLEKEETLQSIDRAVYEIVEASVHDLFVRGYHPIDKGQ